MVLVSKISFKGENSNLLNSAFQKQSSVQVNKTVENVGLISAPDNVLQESHTHKELLSKDKNTYITSAIAIAALGVSTVVAIKTGKGIKNIKNSNKKLEENVSKTMSNATTNLKQGLQDAKTEFKEGLQETKAELQQDFKEIVTTFQDGLSKAKTTIQQGLEKTDGKIKDLGKWQDGQIGGLRNDVENNMSRIVMGTSSSVGDSILLSPIIINGQQFNLATTMHGYGKNTEILENTLRSESTKRIFGIIDRSKMVAPDDITIRIPTSEFKGFSSTGGMSIVPKEVAANLGAIINGKQNARLIVDTPMYLGQVENNTFYSIIKRENGLFDYISKSAKGENTIVKGLQEIDVMEIPIFTDTGKTIEKVKIYLAKDLEQAVDLKLLEPWLDEKTANELNKAVKEDKAFEIVKGALRIKYTPEKGDLKPTARVKYDAVFYQNNKFRMDGPVTEGQAKNIYDNMAYEAGETERFIYFDKFFYENLLKGTETSSERLGADVIIGNDWQTGGISAMVRLLTSARKYFGLEPKLADKIYNTPIITLMHNAGLTGEVWHSQPKLLNVMFGEHAAMISKNAWMPKGASLGAEALNGLFNGANFNPQTMASVYSDILIPVSKGYGNEIASHSGFGGVNHDIFRMRARYHEYSDIEHLKYIARQNGLNEKLVPISNMGYRPITNGCDKVNNKLTQNIIFSLEKNLGLPKGKLRLKLPEESVLSWHKNNKAVYLNKVIEEVKMAKDGKGNPMNIILPELTDLSGVTKDTMVVSTAGRIVDQKGLDIFAEAIEEFIARHPSEEPPVFYIQGKGDQQFINKVLDVKRRVADKFGQEAANRIVFAELFSEPGRYDGCKLMSDFTVMSSWFEPCGLVHKEIARFSGAVPIVNKVGGLTDGLEDGVNAIFSEFRPKFDNYADALNFNKHAFADALDKAFVLFKDEEQFANVIKNSCKQDHSWLKKDGAIQEYAQTLVDLKVLKPEVAEYNPVG